MHPTLVREPFHRDGWVYEEKYDGWRIVAYVLRTIRVGGVDVESSATVTLSVGGLTESITRRFPAHGCAITSQETADLLLPIMSLLRDPNVPRALHGLEPVPAASVNDAHAFGRTFRHLAVALREIARVSRLTAQVDLEHPNDADWNAMIAVRELLPVHVYAAIGLLRRLPDHITEALRLALFRDFASVPRGFRRLAELDEAQVSRLGFTGEVTALVATFRTGPWWFTRLAGRGAQRKGLRDSLEHRLVFFEPVFSAGRGEPVETPLFVHSRSADVDSGAELLSELSTIIGGLCHWCTDLYAAAGLGNGYQESDVLRISGAARDVALFWPRLT